MVPSPPSLLERRTHSDVNIEVQVPQRVPVCIFPTDHQNIVLPSARERSCDERRRTTRIDPTVR